jgi:DNA-binding PadR family transcriptional regulator
MKDDCRPHAQFFMKGFLKSLVLVETSESHASGKEIIDMISETSGGAWRPSPGTIYPVLRAMEKEGLIKCTLSENAGRREILYCSTKKGKEKLSLQRKHILEDTEKAVRVMMPLMQKVICGKNRKRYAKVRELADLIAEHRAHIISLPNEKFEGEVEKMLKVMRDFKKAREKNGKR